MNVFNHKTKIIYGENSKNWLSELMKNQGQGRRKMTVCIATDSVVRDIGLLRIVTDELDKAQIEWKVYDHIQPNPTTDQVESGLKHIIETRPDVLIAIGGGSVIDAAKAIMHACLGLKKMLISEQDVHKPLFVAIPTTSGTGSEVTSYAVITDSNSHVKIPITSDEMLPDVAILDPVFTRSVPGFVTAMTGMDVVTHCLEALMSTGSNQFTDMLARESLSLCFEYLETTVKDGGNIKARAQMHLASCLAGMAFNSAGLGAAHALAHAIGAKYGIAHGLANAICLPAVLRFNLLSSGCDSGSKNSLVQTKIAGLARQLGLSKSSKAHDAIEAFICEIEALIQRVGIQNGMRHYRVDLESLKNDAPELIIAVQNDVCMTTNPKPVTNEDVCKMLMTSY